MNLITSLKLCLRLKCGSILPMKQICRNKDNTKVSVKTNIYCFIFFYFFNVLHDIDHIFSFFFFHDFMNIY